MATAMKRPPKLTVATMPAISRSRLATGNPAVACSRAAGDCDRAYSQTMEQIYRAYPQDREAAMAARMGLRTALCTMNLDLIAQMSCNPAIGATDTLFRLCGGAVPRKRRPA